MEIARFFLVFRMEVNLPVALGQVKGGKILPLPFSKRTSMWGMGKASKMDTPLTLQKSIQNCSDLSALDINTGGLCHTPWDSTMTPQLQQFHYLLIDLFLGGL